MGVETGFQLEDVLAPMAPRQVHSQRPVHGFVRSQQVVIDLQLPRLLLQLCSKSFEVPQVVVPQPTGVHQYPLVSDLQAAELGQPLVRELQLLRGEDVQEHDLVVAVPQVAQGAYERSQLVEVVGQD